MNKGAPCRCYPEGNDGDCPEHGCIAPTPPTTKLPMGDPLSRPGDARREDAAPPPTKPSGEAVEKVQKDFLVVDGWIREHTLRRPVEVHLALMRLLAAATSAPKDARDALLWAANWIEGTPSESKALRTFAKNMAITLRAQAQTGQINASPQPGGDARAVELLREAQKRVSRKWRGHQFDALWLEINDYLDTATLPQPTSKETK